MRDGIAREPLRDQIHQVLARVSVLGHVRRFAERLAQPHVHRARESSELVAGVVDVVLRLDRVALGREDAGQSVANAAARAFTMTRARWDCGDELEEIRRPLPASVTP
jgi:hypothetical protein